LIIDQDRISILEFKSQAPVSAYIDRPMTGKSARESMEAPVRSIHIFWPGSIIQSEKKTAFLAYPHVLAEFRPAILI